MFQHPEADPWRVAIEGGSVTLTDRSVAAATGASQELVGATPGRRSLLVVNPIDATTNWVLNLVGGVAAAGASACITLRPGDSWSPAAPPANAVTGIGAAGAKLTVVEGA